MEKKAQSTAITKDNLISAFWILYQKKSIGQISVKEITHLAGYNRSTFYEYFTDIYEVLNNLEENLLQEMKENIINSLQSLDNSELLQKIAELYELKGEYLSVLLSENGDPNFIKKLKNIMKESFYSSLAIRKDIHSLYIFEFAVSAIIGTITYWYQKKDISSTELIVLIRSMLSNGTQQEIMKYS